MPWPRRSKATSRNSSRSVLSYCLSQQRWFCDQPWMNRIGGPSAFPHSRTCSCKPPPPATVWVCIRPVVSVVVVISGLLVLVVMVLMVVADTGGARRAERLILCRRAPYLPAKGCLRAPSPLVAAARYWPGGGSRHNGAGGARRRARGARGRARRRAGRPRRGRPRGRRSRHRQDAARGRARSPRPRGRLR